MDIDMDATGKLRSEQWDEFVSEDPFKTAHQNMLHEMERIRNLRHQAYTMQQHGRDGSGYLRACEAPQKMVDYIARLLADEFACRYPPTVIVATHPKEQDHD